MARNKFDIDEEIDPGFNPHYVKRLLGYLKPYGRELAIAMTLMLVASLAALASPFIIKIAIDTYMPAKDTRGLLMLAGILLLALLVVWLCQTKRIRIMARISQEVIVTIRSDIFAKLQSLPFTYFDSRPQGKVLIRVVNYVNSLSDLLSNGIIQLVADLFSIILILVLMFIIDVRLTFICMAGLPVLFGAIFMMKRKQHKSWQNVSRKQANLNAYLSESLNGMKITQSFARAPGRQQRFELANVRSSENDGIIA